MDKKAILQTVKKLKADSSKRKFVQSVDLIINLKDLNIKNPDEQVEFFLTLTNGLGGKKSICALVGPELKDEAKKVCDEVIEQGQFQKLTKLEIKKMAKKHDFFIAQANIMPQVATAFGKVLGPKGKMPNPKAGSIVPPKINLAPVYTKLQNTIKVSAKKMPVVQVIVGKEDMADEKLVDNIWQIYDQLVHKLPKEKNNIKNAYLKLTMGKPVKVE